MNAQEQTERQEFTLDVACPICGGHEFTNGKLPHGGWQKTTYWCRNGRGKNPCMGYVCYCKICNKIYPETNFGKHNDVYECKECGNVQWEYTDFRKQNDADEAFMRSFKSRTRF